MISIFLVFLDAAEVMNKIWNILSKPLAIIVYVILLFILIISLIIQVIAHEYRKPAIIKKNDSQNPELYLSNTNSDIDLKLPITGGEVNRVSEIEPNSINSQVESLNESKKDKISTRVEVQGPAKSDEEEPFILETPDNTNNKRFYMLSRIDEEMPLRPKKEFNTKISLKEICEQFRNFSAYKLGLYYDISDIRKFIAGLAVTHILILQGMSGTGKTSLAYAFGEFLGNKTTVVPIQPMWKERTDLIGYYNEFTKKFNETLLLQRLYEANYDNDIYITVLDEMNIARIEYYFAEFLSLLELPNPESRNLDVVSDVWSTDPKLLNKGQLRLPVNMWFVGTANNDDSTFAISDKVYDRAMIINLDKKAVPFVAPKTEGIKLSQEYIDGKFQEATKRFRITNRNLRRLNELDKYMISNFHITFGNRIMKQILNYVPVYVACGGDELQALDDMLSRKVFRKLESQNPVYVRSQAGALVDFIDALFGEENMSLSKEVIEQIKRNV